MKTVKIGVASREEVSKRVAAAFTGHKQGERISFASTDLMHRVLTPARWSILKAMLGASEIGIRKLARRLDRDVKNVHTDVQALVKAGVIRRADDGKVVFPYDEIHVDCGPSRRESRMSYRVHEAGRITAHQSRSLCRSSSENVDKSLRIRRQSRSHAESFFPGLRKPALTMAALAVSSPARTRA